LFVAGASFFRPFIIGSLKKNNSHEVHELPRDILRGRCGKMKTPPPLSFYLVASVYSANPETICLYTNLMSRALCFGFKHFIFILFGKGIR